MPRPPVEISEGVIAEHERMYAEGLSIVDACRALRMSTATFYQWAADGDQADAGLEREFYERVYLLRARRKSTARLQTATAREVAEPEDELPGEAGSLEHFQAWIARLQLDNGEPWLLEPFQEEIAADVLAGHPEIWIVLPEGNGKTTLLAGIALYHAEHTQAAFVPIAASSREQAEVMYRQAEGLVLRSPAIRDHFKCQEGYRRVKCLTTFGRIQVYAADDRTADGVIPTLALVDELHRHRNLKLYRTWRGKLEKRGGQLLTISTAGEPVSEFEDTRSAILKTAGRVEQSGSHARAQGQDIVLHDWAVPDRKAAEDMEAVKDANPLASITVEKLRAKRSSPTMTEEHWQRFVCNLATRIGVDGIKPEEWDRLFEEGLEPDPLGSTLGFLDLGWKIDTTAMGVVVWESPERRVVTGVRVIEPPVDESDVVAGLLDLQRDYSPRGFVYDPNAGGQQMAQLLERGDHPLQSLRGAEPLVFIEHSQDNSPMSRAASLFDEAVRAGWIRHDGNRELRAHVLNGVRKSLGGERYKYDRPADAKGSQRGRYPIDALTGLLMAHATAVAEADTPDLAGVIY